MLLLAALTIGFYWKLTLSRQFTFLNWPDLAYQVLPWYDVQARAWHRGVVPLWDPHQWCGQPLAGQMQPGAVFPLNWPLFWAPLKAGHLNLDFFHWHFVLMHLLAAIFMYAYCRELGRSRFASVLAGAAFSLGGYFATTSWPQMMNGALWTPLIFLFYRRAGRAARGVEATAHAACCGTSLGMALLAGHHQAPLFIALTLGGVFLYRLLTAGGRRGAVCIFALVILFAALAGALALLPAYEYGARAYRWLNLPSPLRMNKTVPYIAQRELGLIPLSLLGVFTPLENVTANPFEGVVMAGLALLGATACWRQAAVRLHVCIALGGLVYALGAYSVFQGLLYAVVPFLDKARSPGHAVLLFHFGLIVTAAHGADVMLAPAQWQTRLVRGLLTGAALLWGAQLLLWLRQDGSAARVQPLILTAAVALLLAVVIHAGSRRLLAQKAAQAAVLALLVTELSAAAAPQIAARTSADSPSYLDRFTQHRGVIEFLRRQKRPFRFHADEEAIPYNAGDWEGLDDTGGYLASVSADLYDFVASDWARSPLLLNQVYVVGRERSRPEQVEVFSEPGGLKVFQNPDAYPRAWVVRSVREVRDPAAGWSLLASRDFNPRLETFLIHPKDHAPLWTPCAAQDDAVDFSAREIDRLAVKVRMACPGMLIVSDPMFPGWRARVDGAPAAIAAAYGALRGVVVGAGEHVVEMTYRPLSVYMGGALSAAGITGCLALALAAARGSRRPPGLAGP
jgi:hypothetical protein